MDRLLFAWSLFRRRINTDIPSLTNRIKAARNRLRGWPS